MNSFYLNKILIYKFPNLKDIYIEETKWQEGDNTGSHIVYGKVFAPYLRYCIENNNINELNKISNFLETLLDINNQYVNEVVAFSVLENILDLLQLNNNLVLLFGDKSRKIIFELKEYYA